MDTTRRGFLGLGAAAVAAAPLVECRRDDNARTAGDGRLENHKKTALEAALEFVDVVLPKVEVYFSTEYANVFNFHYSLQSLGVTGLDRLNQVWDSCIHPIRDWRGRVMGDEIPQFAVMDRWTWRTVRQLIEDTRHVVDVDAASGPHFRAFSYLDMPCVWDHTLTERNARVMYIVNQHSFLSPPDPKRRLNAVVLNTNRS